MNASSSPWRDSVELYDGIAAEYDSRFHTLGYQRTYDRLAGEFVGHLLPSPPGLIVDAGCGTGRWASQWLAMGHRVVGIEQSPQMIEQLRRRNMGSGFQLITDSMDNADIAPGSADMVIAFGSLQYLPDPAATLRRFVTWLKPGGTVCVYMDSLMALVLELLRLGERDEAIQRLETRRGVWRQGTTTAELHLYDSAAIKRLFESVGLVSISCSGLLVSASAWDKARCTDAAIADEDGFLELERRLMADPAMADAGKHIIASGRMPL
jgi:SAM-dependent methyltransferase